MDQHQLPPSKVQDDVDTCRICRGEDGPLFHPCRCSGSIMHVHQDCLMEWLSHSQKKHCELCKTPFRFTKLYHPRMPERLPITIFLQRASLHILKTILTWIRAVCVACTWLIWLPWSMRFVWWGLLWIADGGWVGDHIALTSSSMTQASKSNTSSVSRDTPSAFTKLFQFPNVVPGTSPFGALFNGFTIPQNRSADYMALGSANLTTTEAASLLRRDTILSKFFVLQNLTPSPALNSFIIDVFEGQIIMFSILTAVILVFLIREWVVQQQPAMNLALNDDMLPAAGPAAQHDPVNVPEGHAALLEENNSEDNSEDELSDAEQAHNNLHETHTSDAETQERATRQSFELDTQQAGLDGSATPSRPAMPSRNESFVANDVLRSLEETSNEAASQNAEIDRRLPQQNLSSERAEDSAAGTSEPVANGATTDSSDDFSMIDIDTRDAQGDGEETNAAGEGDVSQLHPLEEASSDSMSAMQAIQQEEIEQIVEEAVAASAQNPQAAQEASGTWLDHVYDWLWGDEVPAEVADGQHEAQAVEIEVDPEMIMAEVPAEPDADMNQQQQVEDAQQDPEVAQAAIQAGLNPNDADAAEELEDLEGLLELIGMQGNLFGLFQNAIFMAVVGAATITVGVWFPYLWGKVMLLFIAHPLQVLIQLPLQLVSAMANFAVDFCIYFGGALVFWVDSILRTLSTVVALLLPSWKAEIPSFVGRFAAEASNRSADRMAEILLGKPNGNVSDYLHLSAAAHASLRQLQSSFKFASSVVATLIATLYRYAHAGEWDASSLHNLSSEALEYIYSLKAEAIDRILAIPQLLRTLSWADAFTIQMKTPFGALQPIDSSQAIWNVTDRLLAVLAGYTLFALLGTFYIVHLAPLATTPQAKKIEDSIVDVLQQAGGIMKVIVIISIEMLLFPLYCGGLLDIATLPLFGATSFHDRVCYTMASPWTSAFIHWFAGTCYMFHFALFVSMCRKIFRSGVLYFIRDPDDPTFHPVRDVLERNLTSQLRKIMFSALIYGGLVIFCMGSVVWMIAYSNIGVLPVRWSSTYRISGFPIDLLLYTSLRPLVVRLWSPSNGLHALYKWWFTKCASWLNLREFVLGHGREDDRKDSGGNGRWVRVPGSDQARIPRGYSVFVDVNEDNERIDGQEDKDEGPHGRLNSNFKVLYVPAAFTIRITAFVICLWALTAVIGLSLTILPLVLGRFVFGLLLPQGTHTSDAYAFAVGAVPLALALYSKSWGTEALNWAKRTFPNRQALDAVKVKAVYIAKRVAKVLYTYSALLLVIPCSFALVVELYLVGPFHAYFAGGQELRVIRLLQGWTLGVQYTRILISIVLRYNESRPARAMRAIVQDGWLDPNVRLATRGFIIPLSSVAAIAVLAPLPIGYIASLILFDSSEAAQRAQVVRFTYPMVLAFVAGVWLGFAAVRALGRWRLRIRDEVYLIGERLHNFGEQKPPSFAKHTATRISHA